MSRLPSMPYPRIQMPSLEDFAMGQHFGRQQQEYNQPLPAPEAAGYGEQLRGIGASGLSHLFGVLNKPGRAVRGLLGGKPHEALSILPLSDSLGITNPKDEVTGEQLNENIGIKKDNSWTSWGAGLGTEILTDPLSYSTFGAKHALTAAGKVASKAGELNKLSRAETIAKGYGGLARIGIPFTEHQAVLGTGKAAEGIAGLMDKAGHAAITSTPGVAASRLFDSRVNRASGKYTQEAQRTVGHEGRQAIGSATRWADYTNRQAVHDLVAQGHTKEDIGRAMHMAGAGIKPSSVLPVDPSLWAAVQPHAARIKAAEAEHLVAEQARGVATRSANESFDQSYFPRQISKNIPSGVQSGKTNPASVRHGSTIRRKDFAYNVPGGQAMVDFLWQHPELSGKAAAKAMLPADRQAKIAEILERHLTDIGWDMTGNTNWRKAGQVTQIPTPEFIQKKSAQLTRWLARSGEVTPTSPFYDPNWLGVLEQRGMRHGSSVPNADAIYRALGAMGRRASGLPGEMTVDRLMTQLSAKNAGGLIDFPATTTGLEWRGRSRQALEALGVDQAKIARIAALKNPTRGAQRILKRYAVGDKEAQELLANMQGWAKPPDELKGGLNILDAVNNMFRSLAYPIWPASHVRNVASGAVQAGAVTGTGPGSLLKAKNVLTDRTTAAELAQMIPGLPAGLTDEEARHWIKRSAYAHGNIGSKLNSATELSSGAATIPGAGKTELPALPLAYQPGPTKNVAGDTAYLWGKGMLDTAKGVGKSMVGGPPAFEMQGVPRFNVYDNTVGNLTRMLRGKKPSWTGMSAPGTKDFPLLEAGRTTGKSSEEALRLGQYMDLLGKGYAESEAGRLVNKTHFDYGQLTPFEKKVMKRAVPFYTYMRNNLPLQTELAATKPGVLANQLRPFMNRDPGAYIPEHLASGVAKPIGEETPEGRQQYLSQIGLPVEEAFERMKFANGMPDLKNTIFAYMGTSSPLIKGPLEALFNTQLFSGRKLSDLKPPAAVRGTLGEILNEDNPVLPAVSQVLANSPATRFITSLDKLTDKRKSWPQIAANMLTGARVSDVDVNASRAIETRKALEAILSRSPRITQHTDFYVKPENRARLTDEDIRNMQMLARIQKNAQLAVQQRKHQ